MFRNLIAAAILAFATPAFANTFGSCQTLIEGYQEDYALEPTAVTGVQVNWEKKEVTFNVDGVNLQPQSYAERTRIGNPVAAAAWAETNPKGLTSRQVLARDASWALDGQLVALVLLTKYEDPAPTWRTLIVGPIDGPEPCTVRASQEHFYADYDIDVRLAAKILSHLPEDPD